MARALTLAQINEQIAELQKKADQVRGAEKAEVVARIKEAIPIYGITAADLGFTTAARKGKSKAAAAKADEAASPSGRPKGRIKYRDDAGNQWSGFGRRPQWYVQALAGGKTEADLLA